MSHEMKSGQKISGFVKSTTFGGIFTYVTLNSSPEFAFQPIPLRFERRFEYRGNFGGFWKIWCVFLQLWSFSSWTVRRDILAFAVFASVVILNSQRTCIDKQGKSVKRFRSNHQNQNISRHWSLREKTKIDEIHVRFLKIRETFNHSRKAFQIWAESVYKQIQESSSKSHW